METDFLKHKHFSKLMGEGSDVDESDDDDDLDIMSENQNMNESGIADQPIKLDTSLMSESMIKLVRTIEERIDKEKLGSRKKERNHLLFSSVQENGEPPVTYCSDFDEDASIIKDDKYKLINDIEQGLNYLYDKGETGIVSEEDTDDITGAKNRNDNFYLDSLMNNNKQLSRLDSKIVKHHLYESSKQSELKTKRKSSGLGSEIKKRLGEKVKVVSTKKFQCSECNRKFHTYRQLQEHLNVYAHRRKIEQNTLVEEKRLSRKSREDSLPYDDRPAKLKKFSCEKRDSSPEKKVVCQHCQEKFFSLENLLYHLRAEHKNRKNRIKESARSTKYLHSNKKDSSLQEKTEENIELSGSESNEEVSPKTFPCTLFSKKFIKSDELDNHFSLTRRNASVSDGRKFVCNLCSKTFLAYYNLIQHIEGKHYDCKTTNKKYVCKFCGVAFLKFQSLMYHSNLAHELK